ncbi:MAG: NCS2 family permease [Bacteroidia bacterium]|jgi:AGZA family xanthine/uracil permease-like MFS transporter|nr:NCS2 family permease [Paludibacter sp.]MDX9919834.1 NCS2 family permease [Paludibacter sp.]NCB68835.1 NCS2 family permease [Bacteroidia bacterium]
MFEKYFKLKENGTNVRTEVIAGITTFLTMAYILAVNPGILSATGMDANALFTATALAAVVGTLVMALWAKLPFALAPGMGLNAFFAFSVVLGMGYSWQFALTAVLIEGIIFILMTIFNIREAIVDAIPKSIQTAISAGIGLFIAFIGLQNAGIIVNNDATLVHLGDITSGSALLALIGLVITSVLIIKKVKGDLLIGIIVTALIGIPMGITQMKGFASLPPSIEPIFFKFDFSQVFTFDMMIVVFTFLFVDIFDTLGTLVGVSRKANMLDKDGKVPNVKKAFMADAVGTTVGAMLGTSTVTTYVESAAGVSEGGRTGLTALVTALCFVAALFFAPLFIAIPGAATAPALILVGLFMLSPIKELDLSDYSESIPAFITILAMPLAYSIAEGITLGALSYVLINMLAGNFKKLSIPMYILAVLFVLKYIFI